MIKINELGIDKLLVNEFLNCDSNLKPKIIDILQNSSSKDEIIKELVTLLIENDNERSIFVDIKKLSLVTGLSIRKLNTLRRDGKIPSHQVSGSKGKRAGRKKYIYNIQKVIYALKSINND